MMVHAGATVAIPAIIASSAVIASTFEAARAPVIVAAHFAAVHVAALIMSGVAGAIVVTFHLASAIGSALRATVFVVVVIARHERRSGEREDEEGTGNPFEHGCDS
jgi:hypothetical protein